MSDDVVSMVAKGTVAAIEFIERTKLDAKWDTAHGIWILSNATLTGRGDHNPYITGEGATFVEAVKDFQTAAMKIAASQQEKHELKMVFLGLMGGAHLESNS